MIFLLEPPKSPTPSTTTTNKSSLNASSYSSQTNPSPPPITHNKDKIHKFDDTVVTKKTASSGMKDDSTSRTSVTSSDNDDSSEDAVDNIDMISIFPSSLRGSTSTSTTTTTTTPKIKKSVRFSDCIIEFRGIDMDREELRSLWIRSKDLSKIKAKIQKKSQKYLKIKRIRQTTIEIQDFLSRRPHIYGDVDFTDDEKNYYSSTNDNNDDDGDECSSEHNNNTKIEIIARIFCGDPTLRGLEKIIRSNISMKKGTIRPVQIHWKNVLDAQNLFSFMSEDDRARAIARHCYTTTSTIWSSMVGREDAKCVNDPIRSWLNEYNIPKSVPSSSTSTRTITTTMKSTSSKHSRKSTSSKRSQCSVDTASSSSSRHSNKNLVFV